MTASDFEQRYRSLCDHPPEVLAGARTVLLPGSRPPWTPSGLRVRKGDAITVLAEGRIVPPAGLPLSGRPRFLLWSRVAGGGLVCNGSQDTTTRLADGDGELELATLQGEWATPRGDLATPREAYAAAGGELRVLVLHWRADPRRGLEALAARLPGDPLVEAERQRLARPVDRPRGWEPHWLIGETDIFREEPDPELGSPVLTARAEDDVGIIRHPAVFPIGRDTRLRWRWRVDALPSARPEDVLLQHDYVSLALEFDDGRDLTWYWSSGLAPETCFACPIPTWTPRETHLVVRSGPDGLGRWHDEARDLHADCERVYGRAPRAVAAAWLIAVTIFQHGRLDARFAGIELTDGRGRLRVGP